MSNACAMALFGFVTCVASCAAVQLSLIRSLPDGTVLIIFESVEEINCNNSVVVLSRDAKKSFVSIVSVVINYISFKSMRGLRFLMKPFGPYTSSHHHFYTIPQQGLFYQHGYPALFHE